MSKIVVGMNIRPAIIPHRIDCGLRNTTPSARPALLTQSCRGAAGACAPRRLRGEGSSTSSSAADQRGQRCPCRPERAPRDAGSDHRAHEELAGRPSGHPEHLRGADQRRRARRGEVGRGDVHRADEREHAARPLDEAAEARELGIPRREQQRADADGGRANGNHLARPEAIHRRARDQAERRVAVVEQADHRGDAQRRQPEGLRQLRHHHGRRRAQRVLVEVVHRRHEPRDDSRPGAGAH